MALPIPKKIGPTKRLTAKTSNALVTSEKENDEQFLQKRHVRYR